MKFLLFVISFLFCDVKGLLFNDRIQTFNVTGLIQQLTRDIGVIPNTPGESVTIWFQDFWLVNPRGCSEMNVSIYEGGKYLDYSRHVADLCWLTDLVSFRHSSKDGFFINVYSHLQQGGMFAIGAMTKSGANFIKYYPSS